MMRKEAEADNKVEESWRIKQRYEEGRESS